MRQPDSEIDDFAAQVKDIVSSRQLAVVPAMPVRNSDSGFVVLLTQEDMSAGAFCDAAVAAGAKIMYVEAEAFDAETDLTIKPRQDFDGRDVEEDGGLTRTLRREASVYNGRIGKIEVAFAANGVLHCWIATAPWYDRFIERLKEQERSANQAFVFTPPAGQPEFVFRAPTPEQLAEQRATVERLAQELAQIPEFRSARTYSQRRQVVDSHPELAAMESDTPSQAGYLVSQAVAQAVRNLTAEADGRYRELETRLRELAVEFAATPAFMSAGSGRARREHAKDFLAERAGGFPPPTRMLELFLDTPPVQRARPGRH